MVRSTFPFALYLDMARLTTRGLIRSRLQGMRLARHRPIWPARSTRLPGEDARGLDDLVAGAVQRDGEACPVRIGALGCVGGVGDGGAQGLVSDEQGPILLLDAVGGPGAQDPAAEDRGLQLEVGGLDGLITNGKFCCVRRLRLSLTWWRRPLRLRASVLQTDVALSGEPDDPDPDVDRLPPAQPAP